jgi:hypothetical protein
MTESLKIVFGTLDAKKEQMLRSQKQHAINKINKFKGIDIDLNNINQYIKVLHKKDGSTFIRVIIGEKKTTFVGKYETLEILRDKAIEFIKSVNTATLPNCSGNP